MTVTILLEYNVVMRRYKNGISCGYGNNDKVFNEP